ncbi:hypothetical protein JCM11641_005833 [Rhodosporidiobolus odoratus]
MAEHPDQGTLAYLQQIPLFLAPWTTFSSSSSHSLFTHQQSPSTASLATKCGSCRAELVAGINGSYWSDHGALWATCGGCGWTTKRVGEADASKNGKEKFERVKKRTRLREKREDAVLHPTALRKPVVDLKGKQKASTGVTHEEDEDPPAVPSRRTVLRREEPGVPASALPPSASSAYPAFASATSSPNPASLPSSSRAAPYHSEKPPPSRSPPASSYKQAPTPSTSASSCSAPPASSSKLPSSEANSTSAMAPKKRKRTKQPSGLAEMLEAKKKKETDAGKGGGLMDFLQRL